MTVIFKSYFYFLLLLNFYSFEFDRRRFYVFIHFGHRRETSALRACFKKISFSKFWPKMANFCHFWPFLAKNRFLDNFFESAHQICLKLCQKLGKVALNHLMTVLCLGKFYFWPFLGQKYIACGDIRWFWAVFGHFLPH